MESPNRKVHVDSDEARAGSTPSVVRYILLISIALAIVALTVIWVTGALSSDSDRGRNEASQRAFEEQQ